MPATKPKPTPPRPAKQPPPKKSTSRSDKTFRVSTGIIHRPQKVVIYGPGGIGKTSLAANIKQVGLKPLLLDVGDGSHHVDVARIEGIETWDELLQVLRDSDLCGQYDAIVVDDLTKCEELAIRWMLENVKHEKGHSVNSIEGYGFGKGFTHCYEVFLQLLQDLDAHTRAGRHVIAIAHECTADVPNPSGENWIRYEPRLQSPSSGKNSIRYRVKEWCDHLIYVGYDVHVDQDGKGKGTGTRAIYPLELPTHMAKSRTLIDPIVYEQDSAEFWKQLIAKEG